MEEQNVIELIDDEGNALKLEHLMTFESKKNYYAAFLPADENEGENEGEDEADEVVIMRLVEDEKGEDVFVTIEDEAELEQAWQDFLVIYEDEEEENGEEEDKSGGEPGKDELGENK